MIKIYITILFIFTYVAVKAQNGILDQSFGTDGIVTIDIGNTNNVMKSIETQPDAKIVMAGYSSSSNTDNFCVTRLNSDGSLDNSFGNGGISITSLPFTSIASAIAIQTDGKILAGGHTWGGAYNEFALIRLLNNGNLDKSFGNSGVVTSTFTNKSGVARSIAVQNDGKIILAGHTYSLNNDFDDFALVRYNTDGTIDANFGTNGIVITSFGQSKDWINKIILQPDGKIISGGFSNGAMALARYNTDGSLDPSFGSNGLVATSIQNTTQSLIHSLAVAQDGSIFTCGQSDDSYSNSTLAKYDSWGNLDYGFGTDGILINNLAAEQDSYKDIKLKNDKIVVGGTAKNNGIFKFSMTQLHSDGTLELSFGTNGTVFTSLSPLFNQLEAIKIQSDGNILAAGFCENFPYDIGVMRILSNTLLSVDGFDLSDYVNIYPNPTLDLLFLEILSPTTINKIRLFDGTGKLMMEMGKENFDSASNQFIINISLLPSGVYSLSLESTNEFNKTYKVVKK